MLLRSATHGACRPSYKQIQLQHRTEQDYGAFNQTGGALVHLRPCPSIKLHVSTCVEPSSSSTKGPVNATVFTGQTGPSSPYYLERTGQAEEADTYSGLGVEAANIQNTGTALSGSI
jgi:hypothetical protein